MWTLTGSCPAAGDSLMTSGVVATSGLESLVLATLPPPPLQPEVALTAGEEDLDEIVALCDDLQMRQREGN